MQCMYVYSIAKTHQPIDPKTHQKPWVDGFWGKNPGFLGTLIETNRDRQWGAIKKYNGNTMQYAFHQNARFDYIVSFYNCRFISVWGLAMVKIKISKLT